MARPSHAHLREASAVASDVVGRRVDLVDRVRRQEETTLASYDEAIALIVAVELAQIELLDEFFGIRLRQGQTGLRLQPGRADRGGGQRTVRDAARAAAAAVGGRRCGGPDRGRDDGRAVFARAAAGSRPGRAAVPGDQPGRARA